MAQGHKALGRAKGRRMGKNDGLETRRPEPGQRSPEHDDIAMRGHADTHHRAFH
jgi:hypothetical protein